ncbi:MAG TPA: FAD-dependent oxidoreductase [bacterium]|nr:FAD-dependent oxidoreductase [bacterium]
MALVQKLPCRVQTLTAHADHVYTLELVPHAGYRIPRFLPGQFLHLALDDWDPTRFWPESRVFSIANSPEESGLLRITYSVRGRYTSRMEKELTCGMDVWVKLPYGDFVIDSTHAAALFAGGTGITAFTAFLSCAAFARPVLLAYGARRSELLLYRELLERRASSTALLRAEFFSETPAPGTTTGRVSVDVVWPEWEQRDKCVCYLSGPPAMLKTLTAELSSVGVASDRIRTDAWE